MDIERERLDGLLRGVLGGVAGLVAMRLVAEGLTAVLSKGAAAEGVGPESEGPIESIDALDDIAIGEIESLEDEPATATLGRLAHEAATGRTPDAGRKKALGQVVHWGHGVLMGGVYGATRGEADGPDLMGGLGFGTALWALGDEVAVPVLGLSEGPTAHSWTDHASALAAHLAYGAVTATATQGLKHVM